MLGKMKVLFLVLIVLSMATAAPAYSSLFPIDSGWSASYGVADSASPPNLWTASMAATGDQTTIGGMDFYKAIQSNWEQPGASNQFWLGCTDTALLISYDGSNISHVLLEVGDVGHSWSYTEPGRSGETIATILSTTWGYTNLGTSIHYDNAYVVQKITDLGDEGYSPPVYEVWLPGVGLLGDIDYWAASAPVYHLLNGYEVDTVPVPPSLVLLASGLVCLAGWRKRSLLR